MDEPVSPDPARSRGGSRIALAGVLVVVVVAVIVVGVVAFRDVTRAVPSFPSLKAQPDPSLHGTVAYFSDRDSCVWIISASGARSKKVLCVPPIDVKAAKELGKPMGPQLVWRTDGRLEVTMFRATGPKLMTYERGWQKVVDVRSGKTTDTPEADVPASPNLETRATVNPEGDAVAFSATSDTGKAKITLSGPSGRRTLLATRGPPNYTIVSAFWSPDYKWIAVDDGRILVVTVGHPSVTRVLTGDSSEGNFGGDDPRHARFAITKDDLLAATR